MCSTGKGNCTGSTVELAFNYIADVTATKQGGMFSVEDIPYNAKMETMGTCDDVTKGKVPLVGIEGWSQLPTNHYQVTMNAVAKVCDSGVMPNRQKYWTCSLRKSSFCEGTRLTSATAFTSSRLGQ